MIQIGGVGAPDEPFMEGWTVLSALAAVTSRIRLSTLATSVAFRNSSSPGGGRRERQRQQCGGELAAKSPTPEPDAVAHVPGHIVKQFLSEVRRSSFR